MNEMLCAMYANQRAMQDASAPDRPQLPSGGGSPMPPGIPIPLGMKGYSGV